MFGKINLFEDLQLSSRSLDQVNSQKKSSYAGFVEKLVRIYPEIKRYDQVVVDDKFFSSCGHMNKAGAEIFTTYLIEKEKLQYANL